MKHPSYTLIEKIPFSIFFIFSICWDFRFLIKSKNLRTFSEGFLIIVCSVILDSFLFCKNNKFFYL